MSSLPLFTDGVACGFPSPAQDYVEKRLSLDDLCIRHPESTYLLRVVCAHAERAAEKLRSEHQYCRKVSVFVSTSPFAAGETFYSNIGTTPLCTPVQDSRVFIPGHRYHKCGVMLSDFHSERCLMTASPEKQ